MRRILSFLLFAALLMPWSVKAQQALPYSYGFEDNDLTVDGWTTSNTSGLNAAKFGIDASAVKTGTYGFRFSSYDDNGVNTQCLISPELVAPNGLVAQFYYKSSSSYYAETFKVGYSTTTTDLESFTWSDEISATGGSWTQSEEFTCPAGTKYVALYYYSNYQYYLYVDDVTFSAPPTCIKPATLEATPASTTSATITWAAGNGETAFDYVYALAGEEADWTSPVTVNALTATITGLDQDADYVFYVRANCGEGDLSAISNVAFHAMRYCTPAPTSVDGSGITAVALGGVEQTEAVHKTNATKPLYADNSTMSFNVPASTVATVDITLATGYNYGTVIWVDWNNNMEFEADEVVYAAQSGSANPTTLNCTFTVPATQAEGTYRMRIGSADSYFDSYISSPTTNTANPCGTGTYCTYEDYSITVTAAPSCMQPATPVVSNITTTGADLAWTTEGTQTQFQYVVMASGTEADWTGATLVTSMTATLSGLTANTAYDVYVRAYCGETEQSDAVMVSFRTACDVITTFPWSENFDEVAVGNIEIPCWNNEHIAGTGTKLFAVTTYSSSGNTTNLGQLPDMSSGTITDLTLPTMAIPAANAYEFNISVYRNASGSSYPQEGLRILALNGTDTAEMAFISRNCSQTYEVNETVIIPNEGSIGWYTYTLVIPTSGNVNIVIRGESKYGAATYFDNLLIREIPSCVKPTALTVADSTITMNSASLSWLAGGSETAWKVRYMAAGDEDWTVVDATTNTFVLNGLQANTAYTVEVAAACGETISDWSTAVAFRTACGVEEVPYVDGFENGIYCWRVGNKQNPTGTSYTASVGSTYKYSGDMGMRMYAYYSNTGTHADSTYAILPAMNFAAPGISKYTLSFYAKSSTVSAYYDQHILVGVVTDPSDMNTFTLVREVEVTGTFAQYEVQFESYEGTGNYMALLVLARPTGTNTYAYGSIYVDDLAVTRTPACQPLASITAVPARTSIEVTLNPKSGLDLSAAYDLVCSATELDNEALEAAQKTVVTDSVYTITGLNRETPYYIYVRANCGTEDGVSAWVSKTVTTKGLVGCDAMTIGTGTSSNNQLPFAGYYHNSYTQQLYLASEINHEAGAISSINFAYTHATSTLRNITVYMANTDVTSLSSSYVTEGLTEVFAARNVTFDNENEWFTLTLDAPFAYTGGNLVVAVYMNYTADETSYNSNSRFAYTSVTGMGRYQTNDTSSPDQIALTNGAPSLGGSSSTNRPNMQFSFCYVLDACPAVTNLDVELVGDGTTEAQINWTTADADYLSSYDVLLSTTEVTDFTEVTPTATITDPTATTYVFSNLTAETHYYMYLRANCQAAGHDEGMSDWVGVDTVMNADCAAPNTLTTEFIGLNAVKAMWNLAFEGQTMAFRYILSDVELDAAGIAAATPVDVDSNVIEISELAYGQVYYLYVASACGNSTSDYINTTFTTYAECAPVTNVTAARVEHNRVLLTWTKNPFGTETAYEVGIVGQEANAQLVDTTNAMIIALDADSTYTAYVKAICGEESASVVETVNFTTASMPGNCATVGTGTNSADLIYSSYGNTYSQQIYTAAELNEMGYAAGTITSISFYYSGTSSTYEKTQSIYMGMVESSSFAGYTANDFIGGLTLVYEPTLLSYQAGWREYELTTPFVWDGTSNIVIGVLTNSTQSSSSGWTTRGTTTSPEYRSIYRYRDNTPIDIEDLASVNYGSRSYNRPNIQICFTPKACPDVTALTISDITTTTAVATWEPIGMETAWKVYLSNVNIVNTATIVGTEVGSMTYAMAQLTPDQDYWFYIQPVCEGADGWRVATFRTVATCFPPTALTTDTVEARTATVSWTDANEVGNYTVAYGIAADFNISDAATYAVTNVTTLNAVLTDLVPETRYAFAVKSNCGVNEESRYSAPAYFTTEISCFAPTNLVASNARANSVVISWTDTHDAAAYTVYYGDAATFSIDDEIYMTADAETKEIVLTGLEVNSSYKVAVKSVCGPNDESAISSVLTFNTARTLPYVPVFGTALPTEMIKRGGLMNADTVYTSALGTSSTPNWTFKASDAAISGAHMKLNIYGANCKAWITTPVFDLSMLSAEDNIVLEFDLALCDYNDPGVAPEQTGSDDKFAVIISEDGGASWMKSNMILWQDNAEDADFSFAGIPTTAQHITINMAPYAGKSICVAFYGESTITGNGDNDLHVGNIRLMKVVNYTEETCQYEMIDNHGFEAATTDSVGVFHFEEMREANYGLVSYDLTVYEYLNNEVIVDTAYVGDHYVDRFYDFYVQEGDEEAYGFEEVNIHGCDSVWLVTFYNILTAETILENHELADGETYIWHEMSITEPGLYYDTVRSEMGGVKAYYELTVTAAAPAPQGKTFELVTTQLADWTGNYLIVFADNKAHATVSGGKNKDLAATSDVLTISEDNKIVTADSCFVTVTAMGNDGYSILLPSGLYLNEPNANSVAESATAQAMTLTYNTDMAGVEISGGNRILYCNTNNGTFYRMYTDKTGNSGYALPQLYKEVSGEGPGTKVEIINAEDGAVKVILNGSLYIIRDNQWYDATGRLTVDPRK